VEEVLAGEQQRRATQMKRITLLNQKESSNMNHSVVVVKSAVPLLGVCLEAIQQEDAINMMEKKKWIEHHLSTSVTSK